MATDNNSNEQQDPGRHPFRRAVFRGLAVLFPPLITVSIFLWAMGVTDNYVLDPATSLVRWIVVSSLSGEIRQEGDFPQVEPSQQEVQDDDGWPYHRVGNNTFIPLHVFNAVEADPGDTELRTAKDYYSRFVDLTYLRWYYTVPFFLSLFLLVLYLLGKFMAAGIGYFFWNRFELVIHRLPVVRNVYSSVKQVSDFLFTERDIEYTRVVAVQYPRKGIYSLGLVTGEGMLDIHEAAGEPILSVLMPTSPMPVTGFTVTVLKSETIDLNITIDQAFQFIISCGVVVPPHQVWQMASDAGALPAPAESDDASPPAADDRGKTAGNRKSPNDR